MSVRIAILDLYYGEPNEGMRAIRELIAERDGVMGGGVLEYEIFDVRARGEVPGTQFDVYLSSGGPGSPFDGEGKRWERDYFRLVDDLWNHNERLASDSHLRKHALFICHSFQMMCRFFALGRVVRREVESFGILPMRQTLWGREDPLFDNLPDPFYAADFRKYEVVEPSGLMLDELAGAVLAREQDPPATDREHALMAIRISSEFVGVQFHPEADPSGMTLHFSKPERQEQVVLRFGEERYDRIMRRMADENYLKRTHDVVLPNFIGRAVASMRPELALVSA